MEISGKKTPVSAHKTVSRQKCVKKFRFSSEKCCQAPPKRVLKLAPK